MTSKAICHRFSFWVDAYETRDVWHCPYRHIMFIASAEAITSMETPHRCCLNTQTPNEFTFQICHRRRYCCQLLFTANAVIDLASAFTRDLLDLNMPKYRDNDLFHFLLLRSRVKLQWNRDYMKVYVVNRWEHDGRLLVQRMAYECVSLTNRIYSTFVVLNDVREIWYVTWFNASAAVAASQFC